MNLVQRFTLYLTIVVAGSLPSIALGQGVVIDHEPRLKGQMLVLLPKLITWPPKKAPSAMQPFTIGIVGQDPFVDNGVNHLEKKVDKKTEIKRYATAADIKDCHILVVSKTADFKKCLENVKGKSILVVSESPGKAKEGAAINLVYDPNTNRIRMEINPPNAARENIRISRGLLRSKLVDIVQ
jgi:hypothetical protein